MRSIRRARRSGARVVRALALLAIAAALLNPSVARAATLEPGLVFEGAGGGSPPDTMGAVGTAHVVEITNGGFAIHAKSDGALLASSSLLAFWQAAGVGSAFHTFDPRVIYDPASERFFVVALNGSDAPNELLVAVSDTADPTLGFTGFALASDSANETWADFPTIGVGPDAVVVAADMIRIDDGGLPVSVDVLVVPKDDLVGPFPTLAGATLFQRAKLATTGFAPQPVTSWGDTGPPRWMLSSAVAFLGLLQSTEIAGPVAMPTLASGPYPAVEALPTPPAAVQPGLAALDAGDGHLASPVQVGDSIWAVHGAQGPAGRAAIRWHELDAATLAVLQSGVLEDPTRDYLFPSVAANALGHVVIGFSASAVDLPASAYAVLGETVDGITRFGTPLELMGGDGTIVGAGVERFGDYSATVADPSDARTFWTFQEIARTGDGAVAIAELRVVPEPAAAAAWLAALLALVALARSRVCAGPREGRTLPRR